MLMKYQVDHRVAPNKPGRNKSAVVSCVTKQIALQSIINSLKFKYSFTFLSLLLPVKPKSISLADLCRYYNIWDNRQR